MKKVALLLPLVFFVTTVYSKVIPNDTVLKAIYERCRALLLSDTAYATEQSYLLTDEVKYTTDGNGYFKSLTAKGNWADIDYQSKQAAAWMPANHLYRVLLIARAYSKNHNPAYLDAIHRAIAYWIKNDIQCSNWWQNEINTPFTFSSLMLMLGKDARSDEMAYLDNVLTQRASLKKATGQNLIWQLDNQSRIALVHHDYNAFAECMKNMQAVITISAKEGIQPDYSFQQHGVMLQFGNYGLHFVNSLLFWMTITANTPLAFAPDKQQILFNYCSRGLRWTVFNGAMDLTAVGRQFREDCDTKRGNCLYVDFNLLKSFDKKDACKYAMDGFDLTGCALQANKSFWRSAYMVQLAKNKYMMSVKMHGSLVKKLESINGDNLRGSFLNDGVTLIQRTGNKYHNIEPLWNWRMLPGVTSDTTINPESKATMATSNVSAFVGQASDGVSGISAMIYNRLGVKANKSYFFTDGMMVALGAGITCDNPVNLVTTVNQSLSHGQKIYSGQSLQGRHWLNIDNTAYIFSDKGQTIITTVNYVHGNWGNVDKGSGDVPVADSVVTAYIGQAKNSKYVYIVKPGIGIADTKKLAVKNPVMILANTTNTQAIRVNNRIMAVFYTAGTLVVDKNESLKTDSPCIVMYQKGGPVWVSDPTQKLQNITLKINKQTLSVKLPSGDYAGSTVKIDR